MKMLDDPIRCSRFKRGSLAVRAKEKYTRSGFALWQDQARTHTVLCSIDASRKIVGIVVDVDIDNASVLIMTNDLDLGWVWHPYLDVLE